MCSQLIDALIKRLVQKTVVKARDRYFTESSDSVIVCLIRFTSLAEMSINVCVDPSPVAPGLALLYERQYLTDVRLVCGDGKVLVHKVVLFAVSDLLQDLLSDQSGHHCDNTVILLDNSVTDVKKIIDCLYYGHQSIASNRFSYLSRIAAKLGIVLRSAVSVALEDNKQTIDWQRALPPTPHPKTGRRSTISSSHKKLINRLAVTAENVESDPFVLPSIEQFDSNY